MHVNIKTYDEVSTERVRIEVVPGQRVEITFDGELSTVTETVRTAETRDRSNGELRRRIAELERSLSTSMGRESDLEEKLAVSEHLAHRVREFDRDRHTEQRRADENREWAKRAEAKLAETLTALEESRALVAQRDAALDQAADDLRASRDFRAQEREEARRRIAERDATAVRQAEIIADVKSMVSGFRADQALAEGADPEEHMDVLARKIKLIRRAVSLDPRAVSLDRTLDAEAHESPQA
jgi:hypothetical protein